MFEAIFNNVVVASVPVIILTTGLVEFSKRLGANGKVLLILAMVYGVMFFGGVKVAEMFPQIQIWIELVVYGLGGGLATTGIYDIVNKRLPEIETLE